MTIDATAEPSGLPPTDWLILRGLAREQGHWGDFPGTLAATLGARVHTLDLPGAGVERDTTCPVTVADIVTELRRRWLPLATPGSRWGLLGISLGGMIAMQWPADHPQDFTRIVLANTSARNTNAPWRRMRPAALGQVLRALGESDPLRREGIVLAATTRLQPDLSAVAARWATIATERPIRRGNVLRQLLAAMRFTAPRALTPRVLVLGGGADPLTDPSCPRALAERFDAPLHVHPDAGHDLSLDAPAWIAATVATWLQG